MNRRSGRTSRVSAMHLYLMACVVMLPTGISTYAQEKAADAEDQTLELPLHLSDPVAFREQACKQAIADLYTVKVEPEEDDTLLDLMPKGTVALPVVNPGFEFTYDNGKKPGNNYWFVVFKAGDKERIGGGGRGKTTDPIQGWNTYGCAGFESGRPLQWATKPDGCTGYIVAQNRDTHLYQDVKDALKPNTRYTLLVEVYKRKDYKRAERKELIVKLTDGQGKPLKVKQADHLVEPADLDTGFSISMITLTTAADQAPGDLRIVLGMNAEGAVRANFDNVKLWAQPDQ